MIRIAVCDDFKDTVNQVNGYLSEYQQLRNRKLDIKSFFNAEDLWEYLRVTSKNPQKYRQIEAFSIIGQILTSK